MRVTHVSLARPREGIDPGALLDAWPTLGAVAGAVAKAGTTVSVVQSFHSAAAFQRDGVHYAFVPEPAWPGRSAGLHPGRIARAVAGTWPDIIHINGLDFPWHTRALTRLGTPVVVQDHASSAAWDRRRRRWGLRHVAGALFTSAAQAETFVHEGVLRPDVPVFAVPESSTSFTAGDRQAARAATGLSGDPAILWVGRLDGNKDPLTILDAMERAERALPGLKLWCAFHDAPLLAAVERRIASSPTLGRCVRLIGQVAHERVETLCRAADFFMLGSHSEGSGYALIEAIACGATPVVSDIPPFRAITADGRIGALAPVGDADAFASALVRLAHAPRADLRAAAAAHFAARLSFERIGARLVEIYATILRARR